MAANKYDANSISILEGLEAVRMRPGMEVSEQKVLIILYMRLRIIQWMNILRVFVHR